MPGPTSPWIPAAMGQGQGRRDGICSMTFTQAGKRPCLRKQVMGLSIQHRERLSFVLSLELALKCCLNMALLSHV